MADSSLRSYFFLMTMVCLPAWMVLSVLYYGLKTSVPTVEGSTLVIQDFGTTSSPGYKCNSTIDGIGLVSKRKIDVKSVQPLRTVEQLFFGDQLDQIRITIARGNNETQKLIQTARRNNTALYCPIMESLSSLEVRCGDYKYLPGGHWRPATCKPRWKVAIVIPYRKRPEQLSTFLWFMVPFLKRQLHEFAIYVVNQEGSELFNRGLLLNVGFLESLNFTYWDCFVMHDVDHIPTSDFNPYGCVDMPRHFIGGSDNLRLTKPYPTSFGGVSGLTREQFQFVNGYSNKYWGWCCEDDDISDRISSNNLTRTRYGKNDYFRVIQRGHYSAGPRSQSKESHELFKKDARRGRYKTDGLNSIVYEQPHLEFYTLYTNISVDLHKKDYV